MKTLLMQASPADQAAGLIVIVATFVFAIILAWIGFVLMKSGTKLEKSGIEFSGFKVNLETTTGGICMVIAVFLVMNFLSKFYGR